MFLNQTIDNFSGLRWLFVFNMFRSFLTMIIIGLCIFLSSIFRSVFKSWNFTQYRLILCFWGYSFSSDLYYILLIVTRVDVFAFLDKIYWSSISCGETIIYGGVLAFKQVITFWLFVSFFLDIIDICLDLELFFNKVIPDLDPYLNQIVVLK